MFDGAIAAFGHLEIAANTNHRLGSWIMPDPSAPVSFDRDQAILLASRLFAAFLLFWVIEDITELPREIFTVMHYSREASRMGIGFFLALRSTYLLSDYVLYLLANILHIALWLLGAGWFYRCGPRIRKFFT